MLSPTLLLSLKKTIELAYRDGITRILSYQVNWDSVTGQFLDRNDLFDFTIDADGVGYKPVQVKGQRKDDVCSKGRACGEGCVSRDKACHVATITIRRAAGQFVVAAREEVVLKEHQTRIAEKLRDERGLVVDHGLGSGKTLTAINAAEEYGGAVVITPASLQDNFKKELVKAQAKGKYDVYSYETFRSNPPDLKGRMLIVDEAHRLRNSATQTSQVITESSKDAHKVLLLTGTPIQDKPHEIAPLVNMAAGENILPVSESGFGERYLSKKTVVPNWYDRTFRQIPVHTVTQPKNLKEFEQRTARYVDHFAPTQEGYPSVAKQVIEVEMSKDQIEAYKIFSQRLDPVTRRKMQHQLPMNKQESSNFNEFINAQRQISNTDRGFNTTRNTASPKVKAIVDRVETSPGPTLIYSNYLESGTDAITQELKARNIKHGTFTGQMTAKEKNQAVADYNAGKAKVLIVSSSGGEGLDLKNTAQVHITEPHWNREKIQQVMGRAVRYQSHASLPVDRQNVDVFEYISVMPNRKDVTADQYLTQLSQKKKELNGQFLARLRKRRDAEDIPFVMQLKTALELVYRDGMTRILDWQPDGKRITGRFLDGNELFSFTIDPDGISYKPEPIPRKDAYLVGFLARSQGMESLLVLDSLEYWTGYLLEGQKRDDQEKQCEVGRACGDGCVSKDKSCRVTTPQVKRAAIALLSRGNTQALPPAQSSELERKIRLKEDEIRLLDHERAIAYDAQGNVVLTKDGGSGSVMFSGQEMEKLKGSTMTHNHPAAMYFGNSSEIDGGSFSIEDWQFAANTELREIRAVGAEARYSLSPPKEGWSEAWWQEKGAPTYQKNLRLSHSELVQEIQAGKITPERANIEVWHRTSDRAAKELGMTYKRKPNAVTERDRAVILKNLPNTQIGQNLRSAAILGGGALIGAGLTVAAAHGIQAQVSAHEERLKTKAVEQKQRERKQKEAEMDKKAEDLKKELAEKRRAAKEALDKEYAERAAETRRQTAEKDNVVQEKFQQKEAQRIKEQAEVERQKEQNLAERRAVRRKQELDNLKRLIEASLRRSAGGNPASELPRKWAEEIRSLEKEEADYQAKWSKKAPREDRADARKPHCKVGKLCNGRCIPRSHECNPGGRAKKGGSDLSTLGIGVGVGAIAAGVGLAAYGKYQAHQLNKQAKESRQERERVQEAFDKEDKEFQDYLNENPGVKETLEKAQNAATYRQASDFGVEVDFEASNRVYKAFKNNWRKQNGAPDPTKPQQEQTWHTTLGVDKNATPSEIKAAYAKLSRQYHPDKNGDADAAERFHKVSEAYAAYKFQSRKPGKESSRSAATTQPRQIAGRSDAQDAEWGRIEEAYSVAQRRFPSVTSSFWLA